MTRTPTQWNLLNETVKGPKKRHSQDASLALSVEHGSAVVLAVADGHGSAAYFRSDVGSAWAVAEFADCARTFAAAAVRADQEGGSGAQLHNLARDLPHRVVRGWRRRVQACEYNSPAHGGLPGTVRPPADLLPYGSTLIGAVLTANLLVAWQLGDGECAVVDGQGDVQLPLYVGEEFGDVTDSLCRDEAWRWMRMHWQPLSRTDAVRAVVISTDGLSKSFTEHAGYLDFVGGTYRRVQERGVGTVQGQLDSWLSRAAAHSGDDTTLVGAFAVPDLSQDRT